MWPRHYTGSPNKPAPSRNNGRKPAFGTNDGNGKIDKFRGNGVEHAKKSEKSKGQKMSKSQKSVKSQKLSKPGKFKGEKPKKPSKIGNSPNFNAKDSGPSLLIPGARETFNRLRLIFNKIQIF